MIQQVSLAHGWYYFYRLHTERLNYLPEQFSDLNKYLTKMLSDCPDKHFLKGPRSSALKFDLGIETKHVDHHPVSKMAIEGLKWARYKTAHSNVQVYMLNNDPQTLAVEVPIWLKSSEVNIGEKGALSGHIDLLRWEGDKMWVWDYKPKAHKEKYATTQTFFYSLMLSHRTGIPLDNFMCGYFDDENTYIFKPEQKLLNNI